MIVDAKHRTSERAYFIWEALGRPEGYALDHWLQAEAELTAAPALEVEPKPQKKKAVKKKTKTASSRKKAKKSS